MAQDGQAGKNEGMGIADGMDGNEKKKKKR